MRTERPIMVQTAEQYTFIHQALIDHILGQVC